jgi:four helix bundle protein
MSGAFRELVVWKRAFALCRRVYEETQGFPSQERYGLTSELRKTSRSVVYNIAEGHRRWSRQEFSRFLDIALGSSAELETQLLLAESLGYLDAVAGAKLRKELDEINRMAFVLRQNVRPKPVP